MDKTLPLTIRVSIGSAIRLGLAKGSIDAVPTTVYLLTYVKGKCTANCAFCSQARESSSRSDMLSRVTWPTFPLMDVVNAIGYSWVKGEFKRICVQTVNRPQVFSDTVAIVNAILENAKIPISVSSVPLSRAEMIQLQHAGVERIGIPLDAATKELFDKVKGYSANGPYRWERHLQALRDAVEVFGVGKVSTHLMVGLGETDRDLLRIVQDMTKDGIYPALFAFTPIIGSKMEKMPQPDVSRYHRIQLAHSLITRGISTFNRMSYDLDGTLASFGVDGRLLREVALSGLPFMTSGCPNCNRPYYNERPGGEIFNYPGRPSREKVDIIMKKILEDR